jgi:hypothetical protein
MAALTASMFPRLPRVCADLAVAEDEPVDPLRPTARVLERRHPPEGDADQCDALCLEVLAQRLDLGAQKSSSSVWTGWFGFPGTRVLAAVSRGPSFDRTSLDRSGSLV